MLMVDTMTWRSLWYWLLHRNATCSRTPSRIFWCHAYRWIPPPRYGNLPVEYMVLRVQVKFAHSLLRCGWLWVGHNLFLLWDYSCFIPSRLPVFAVEPQCRHQDFLFLSKVSFEGHIQYLRKKSCWFKIWMVFVGPILIKLRMSFIWNFL